MLGVRHVGLGVELVLCVDAALDCAGAGPRRSRARRRGNRSAPFLLQACVELRRSARLMPSRKACWVRIVTSSPIRTRMLSSFCHSPSRAGASRFRSSQWRHRRLWRLGPVLQVSRTFQSSSLLSTMKRSPPCCWSANVLPPVLAPRGPRSTANTKSIGRRVSCPRIHDPPRNTLDSRSGRRQGHWSAPLESRTGFGRASPCAWARQELFTAISAMGRGSKPAASAPWCGPWGTQRAGRMTNWALRTAPSGGAGRWRGGGGGGRANRQGIQKAIW